MKWRMTYTNINGAACSARGIAHRNSKEELEILAEVLEGKIEHIKIEQCVSAGIVPQMSRVKNDEKVDHPCQ